MNVCISHNYSVYSIHHCTMYIILLVYTVYITVYNTASVYSIHHCVQYC